VVSEEKSRQVEGLVLDHIRSFGGVYEMRDDLEVIVYQDHDSHDLKVFSYDEYLENIKEVMGSV